MRVVDTIAAQWRFGYTARTTTHDAVAARPWMCGPTLILTELSSCVNNIQSSRCVVVLVPPYTRAAGSVATLASHHLTVAPTPPLRDDRFHIGPDSVRVVVVMMMKMGGPPRKTKNDIGHNTRQSSRKGMRRFFRRASS
jgi:hypothetical protein